MTIVPPNDVGPTRRALRRFLGGVLMTAGGIVALLSGLCSLVFLVGAVADLFSARGGLGGLVGVSLLALMCGGAPFLVGLGLFFLGRNVWRAAETPDVD